MSSYETHLRQRFPAIYEDALRILQDEEAAAIVAQRMLLTQYRACGERRG